MRKRNIQIITRLDREENDRFQKRVKRAGLSKEAYVRHLINGYVPSEKPPPDFYDVMKELHAIGRNLNQIAQKAHVLNVIDARRFDKAIALHNKAVVSIMNAVMLPRKMPGASQSREALWGEERPRSDEPFADRQKR